LDNAVRSSEGRVHTGDGIDNQEFGDPVTLKRC
jgi:hypothetical protein